MIAQTLIEESYHERDWGWPKVTVHVHPSVGETVLLPDKVYDTHTPGRGVVISDDGHEVRFGMGKASRNVRGQVEYPSYGGLRISGTCDGLILIVAGTENDGWSCVIKRNGPPGKRLWQVKRGGRPS